jgi:hypothetical protein
MTRDLFFKKTSNFYKTNLGSLEHFDLVVEEANLLISKINYIENYYQLTYTYITTIYLPGFIEKIKEGYGYYWSHKYSKSLQNQAEKYFNFLKNNCISNIYITSEFNIEMKYLKNIDLEILKHYSIIYLIKNIYKKNVFEKTDLYINAYSESKKLGYSDFFSIIYSILKCTQKHSEIYCMAFSFAYEQAILLAKGYEYSILFAKLCGTIINNKYTNFDKNIINDKKYHILMNNVIGYIQAIYVNEFYVLNKDFDLFVNTYTYQFVLKYDYFKLFAKITDSIDIDVLETTLIKLRYKKEEQEKIIKQLE